MGDWMDVKPILLQTHLDLLLWCCSKSSANKIKKRVATNSKENITNVNTIKEIRRKKQRKSKRKPKRKEGKKNPKG